MTNAAKKNLSDILNEVTGEEVYDLIANPGAFAKARGVAIGDDLNNAFQKVFRPMTPDLTPVEMSPGGAVAAGARAAASSAAKSVADGALKAAGATAVAVGAKATGILSIDPDFACMNSTVVAE